MSGERNSVSGKDWIRESTRQAIYHRDGDRCLACNGSHNLSLDHVKPNGDNRPSNLITLCVACNRDKSTLPLEEWSPNTAIIARHQTRMPIDRAEGLRRAKLLRPARFAAEAFRRSKVGKELMAKRRAERERMVEEFRKFLDRAKDPAFVEAFNAPIEC